MAADPAFAVTPRIGSVAISTLDSSLTAPTNFGTLITGAATGTRVAEIVAKCAATSVAALVRVFLHDGTSTFLLDELTIAAATSSNTAATTRVITTYNNLVLPSASWSIRVTTTAGQAVHMTAFGADL
jgi:hypothetical protein